MPLVMALLLSAAALAVAEAGCPYAVKTQVQAFSSFTAQPLTQEQLTQIKNNGTETYCVTEIAPCDPAEGRRLDGSCTNPRYPTFGHGKQPFRRLLPAQFAEGGEPRAPKSNRTKPLFRQKRKRILPEGRLEDQRFTQLLTHALAFLTVDIINTFDELNFVVYKPYCCKPEGARDSECAPNYVADDDETMRFSSQRCMNMTKPGSFQVFGCLPNGTDLEWINTAPPLLEMSVIYGETEAASRQKARKNETGLLQYEVDGQGLTWPPNANSNNNTLTGCLANNPDEYRCHDTPNKYTNGLLGINLFTIWLWRHHNLVARELAARNPCWRDDKLFEVARDISIAMYQQWMYNEMFAELMGHENLIARNIISDSLGFRDTFDETVIPQPSLEGVYVLRWVHTIQGSDLRFYDEKGHYMKNYPVVNLTQHTGFLDHDQNLQGITQGSFRQGCGAFDHIADPDMMTIGFGPFQDFLDIMTNDLSKASYFGLPPYTKYREYCSGKSYKSFDDLRDNITPERIQALKDVYGDVEDVELLAGIWLESFVEGGHVPKTFYCIVADLLQNYVASDQHWYERPNRPNAFTLEQLAEVRKSTVALLLCTVGDTVTEIQPRAFRRAGPGNEMTSCANFEKVNFDAWIDSSCSAESK